MKRIAGVRFLLSYIYNLKDLNILSYSIIYMY